MNILLVSQCTKNALTETRRILDQFAERNGERTWKTPITKDGLDTLRRLLRKTARKNTAVACHWIRARDHSELLWVVGDASRFNAHGATPTNTTSNDVLRSQDENDWHTGADISLLSALSALLHDLGKACQAFQEKLRPDAPREGNLYRHEWISLRLFEAFVGDDDDFGWLRRLSDPTSEDDDTWLNRLRKDSPSARLNSPFKTLPPLACAVGWLVLTHHRLPVMPDTSSPEKRRRLGAKVTGFQSAMLQDIPACIDASWNETCETDDPARIAPYWTFPHGLPVTTEKWRRRAARLAERLSVRLKATGGDWLSDSYVMHVSRLTLMLSDHFYSSLSDPKARVRGQPDYPLLANTIRATGEPNQRLDEHLIGVEAHSRAISRSLPHFEHHLPRLARHKGFRKRSGGERFRWQDKAYDLAVSLRDRSRQQGFFGVNMASTGCGKTLANGRILYALSDPERGARFSVALGLRTLTLQTGQAYRELLGLGEDELAVRVGGTPSRALFEHYQRLAEASGSASAQSLLSEDSYVYFEGNFDDHPLLKRLAHDPNVKSLIAAPILVCTVDHLAPATESQRGGRQIAPMLRLMSGDLVLDEPDDFDLNDLPALTRLVHWAGMLGTRVLLSSATLPPSLLHGLFEAYRDGRGIYQKNRGEPGRPVNICCAWFDENDRFHQDCPDSRAFNDAHARFAADRYDKLAKAEVRRRAQLAPLSNAAGKRDEIRQAFASDLRDRACELHAHHHSVDPHSGKRVSFGLIRMANIEPIFDVALALYELGGHSAQRIHLCVYHSQYPLLIRSAMEDRLDRALNRRIPEAVFDIPDVRQRLDSHPEPDHLFIVLGSPVTEVGRDHDYDWAVVEPSSMRSIIQLAGRVRRHRAGGCTEPNIALLDTNLRHMEQPERPAFCKPGFETQDMLLVSHRLENVLNPEEREVIDSRPRIVMGAPLRPRENLVDLEHHRLQCSMLPADGPFAGAGQNKRRRRTVVTLPPLGAHTWWGTPQIRLTAVAQQQQPFREDLMRRVDLVLLPDDAGDNYRLMRIEPSRGSRAPPLVAVEEGMNHRVNLGAVTGPGICAWGEMDYMEALATLAEQRDMALDDCARRFGTVTLPDSEQGWCFHPALGYARWR